ncbi:MAG: hypothetical protein ABUL62_34030 [Myxococcales bacterium]
MLSAQPWDLRRGKASRSGRILAKAVEEFSSEWIEDLLNGLENSSSIAGSEERFERPFHKVAELR